MTGEMSAEEASSSKSWKLKPSADDSYTKPSNEDDLFSSASESLSGNQLTCQRGGGSPSRKKSMTPSLEIVSNHDKGHNHIISVSLL